MKDRRSWFEEELQPEELEALEQQRAEYMQQSELSGEEKIHYITGAVAAGLLVAGVFLAAMFFFLLFATNVWLK